MTEEMETEKKDEYFRVITAEKHLLAVLLHDVTEEKEREENEPLWLSVEAYKPEM